MNPVRNRGHTHTMILSAIRLNKINEVWCGASNVSVPYF